jgi:arylsulfatase A
MNKTVTNKILILSCGLLLSCFSVTTQAQERKNQAPNIVYILADDIGFGDISLNGQKKFQTPNIDKLAKEGMVFTQFYSGSTVCAPSRSTLMTGLHTGHTYIRGNKEIMPEGQHPIPDATFTMAEMLQKAGYVTGAFGKWGLGYPGSEGEPNKQGFDTFFGFNCQRIGHNYYPHYLWNNQEKYWLAGNVDKKTEEYAPEVIHKQALQFLEDNRSKPFFMYYPSIIPHAELLIPEPYLAKYRGKFLPEKDFKGVDDGPDYKIGGYGSQPESHAAFAAMVDYLDMQVGEIVAKLKELGVYENTLIIFTSDNGPHQEGGADPDYFDSNGSFKGYKRDLYEGGIRVPMIASWPGKIKAGSKTDHISAAWDVMPTIASLTDTKTPKNIDGISFLPTLLGKKEQKKHDYMYWEFHELGGRQAIRKGKWKFVRYDVLKADKTTTELYDLSKDIGETTNVAAQNPEVVKEMMKLMKNARTQSTIFTFQSPTVIK